MTLRYVQDESIFRFVGKNTTPTWQNSCDVMHIRTAPYNSNQDLIIQGELFSGK